MRSTRKSARDAAASSAAEGGGPDAAPAAAPKAKAKAKGKGKGKGEVVAIAPRGTPRRLPGLVNIDPVLLMEAAAFLNPIEALTLAYTCKGMLVAFKTPAAGLFWRNLLMSKQVDVYGCYAETITEEHRKAVERHFGPMAIVSALMSNKCGACGAYTTKFNILTGTRACRECWSCADGGENGRSTQSPFALCTVSFAKQHFLLTDGQIKQERLLTLQVDDPQSFHGLGKGKISLVLAAQAKLLGEERFGGSEEGVAEEKRRRYESTMAAKPRTEANDANKTNYPCRNQRCHGMFVFSRLYGLYHDIYAPEIFSAPPTIFITRDSQLEVTAKYPHATAELFAAGKCSIHVNAVEAFVNASKNGGVAVLIDKVVNIDADFQSCDQEMCASVLGAHRDDLRIGGDNGGVAQRNTIMVNNDVKIVATDRGSLQSTTACFAINTRVAVEIENLRMTTSPVGPNNPSPVICSSGFLKMTKCRLVSNGGSGYNLLAHGRMNEMHDCDFEAENCMCVHFNAPHFPDSCVIQGCTFTSGADWAFFENQDSEPGQIAAFVAEVAENNTLEQNQWSQGYGGDGYANY